MGDGHAWGTGDGTWEMAMNCIGDGSGTMGGLATRRAVCACGHTARKLGCRQGGDGDDARVLVGRRYVYVQRCVYNGFCAWSM